MMVDDRHRYRDNTSPQQRQAEFVSLETLLHKQTAGKIPLTREEKQRLQKYEKEQRNKNK